MHCTMSFFFLGASTVIFILHKYLISYMLLLFSVGSRFMKKKAVVLLFEDARRLVYCGQYDLVFLVRLLFHPCLLSDVDFVLLSYRPFLL
jgi:hypothetical protein